MADLTQNAPTAENPPYGLATYLGIAAALVQYVTALVILIVGGPLEASVGALGTATVSLVAVLTGRYSQAKAQIIATAVNPLDVDDATGDVDVPSDDELTAAYPADPPPLAGEEGPKRVS